ncbi:hypothetical protein PVL29_026264 [Vitis rotundifolia]|uniref:Uncharacterized protein n=1 Tax=Vitis rotundifolia TaxID=103349 RepID=A0AA38YM11_VITRO|nr:hypothetical protein PVL29_026264 [Vitis rotundifolia]
MSVIGNNRSGVVGENGFPPFTNCYLPIPTPSLAASSCTKSSIAMTYKSAGLRFPPTLVTILSAYLSSLYFMGGLVMRFRYGVFRLELRIYYKKDLSKLWVAMHGLKWPCMRVTDP